jgi:hypothetical protein
MVFDPYCIMFNDVYFSCPTRVYRAVLQVDGQSLCVQPSSVRKYLLFKWHKDICNEVITVHFDASREFIDNMKSQWIPCHYKHELFRVNIMFTFCSGVISGENLHLAWRIRRKEPRLVLYDKMMLNVLIRHCQNRNDLVRISASLFSQFLRQ